MLLGKAGVVAPESNSSSRWLHLLIFSIQLFWDVFQFKYSPNISHLQGAVAEQARTENKHKPVNFLSILWKPFKCLKNEEKT